MENKIQEISKQIQEINDLEKKRNDLITQLNTSRRNIIKNLTTKPGWFLFIVGYCTEGDKYSYIGYDIDTYIKNNSLLYRHGKYVSISFEGEKVIIRDFYYWQDDEESWKFVIPIKKFIEFCSTDDYMQKVLERYSNIKKIRENYQ